MPSQSSPCCSPLLTACGPCRQEQESGEGVALCSTTIPLPTAPGPFARGAGRQLGRTRVVPSGRRSQQAEWMCSRASPVAEMAMATWAPPGTRRQLLVQRHLRTHTQARISLFSGAAGESALQQDNQGERGRIPLKTPCHSWAFVSGE